MKRTISLQISQLSKEGWLQKRGQLNKTWKKRYFILKNVNTFFSHFSGYFILFYRQQGQSTPTRFNLFKECKNRKGSKR
jgi:hypothetical protein